MKPHFKDYTISFMTLWKKQTEGKETKPVFALGMGEERAWYKSTNGTVLDYGYSSSYMTLLLSQLKELSIKWILSHAI